MKISDKYKVREMAGQHVVIIQGKHGEDMTRIISLNESSLFFVPLYIKDSIYNVIVVCNLQQKF